MPPETVSDRPVPLRERTCRFGGCQKSFYVCQRCDRGQRYCSPECRDAARKLQHRSAVARYQRTPNGRRRHADHQRALRERRRARAENKVTDPSSPAPDTASSCGCDDHRSAPQTLLHPLAPTVLTSPQPIPPNGLRCQFCGCRGYLQKRDADEPDYPARCP
jgi:hypothetical protein